jgi:peroxiredoxin (alkyl hydroperoxide reductase subunit C)
MIEAGTPAPEFKLRDQDGQEVTLEALKAQTSVLVFYPLDFSPVCTDQLSIYQELIEDFQSRGVKLYGVSVDSAFCHKAFREKLNLSFSLLADFEPKGEVARKFGVYNDEYGTSQRALVMIGPDGIVQWSYCSPSPLEIPGANLIFDALQTSAA